MDARAEAIPSRSGNRPVVLEAITRLNIGGPGRHVLGVANGLADRYDIGVVTGTAPTFEGELPPGSAAVTRLPMVRAVDIRRDTTSVVAMRRLVRHRRVDLVHSHMAKAGAVSRLATASMRGRPRTVHTFHGHVLAGYFSRRTESVFAEAERRLARHTDRLVAVSDDVRDALLDLGIGRPSQYEVLPLGVDLDPYLRLTGPTGALRSELGIDADVPLLGVCARLAPIKDHRTLFEAMVQLPGVHLAVLGDGELRRDLGGLAATLGIGERTHFTGWWLDMPAALADLDVAVLSSRNEGTPMSLIEASAAGRAVVATSVGGVPAVVRHERTGVLVPPGDPNGLARALRSVVHEPRRRHRLGEAGREHVREHFGLRTALDRLAELYAELLRAT